MRGPARRPPAHVALPQAAAAERRFDAACTTFDAACAAHDYARDVLLQRLSWFDGDPRVVLDAGCGTGRATAALRQRFPQARVLSLDRSAAMIAAARSNCRAAACVRGDAEKLPIAERSVDLVLANLLLPWCDPQRLLGELARVLTANGLLLLSTTGPATLGQLRRAWRAVDEQIHVHASPDLQTLGDLVARAGLREPVLDSDSVTLRYSAVTTLHEELRAVGASNVAGGRRRTLTGKGRYAAYERELCRICGPEALDVTVEFYFVQAWGPAAPATAAFQGIPVRRE